MPNSITGNGILGNICRTEQNNRAVVLNVVIVKNTVVALLATLFICHLPEKNTESEFSGIIFWKKLRFICVVAPDAPEGLSLHK